ncbi:hypothetical protein [Nisaea denitrificans]|uniref:hypothetical protein n=1 Tax=Nisaea denitrificans TaxID=390877 RepID=UPI0012EB10CD|nr:hypothetical protein [Nisaea denitrificans]
MPILFNSILENIGIDPQDIRLLRHHGGISEIGKSPLSLWKEDRNKFIHYQETQAQNSSPNYWASFAATPDGGTLFLGIYTVQFLGILQESRVNIIDGGYLEAGSSDLYENEHDRRLADLEGRHFIDWGKGVRAWVQKAENQNKLVTELLPS